MKVLLYCTKGKPYLYHIGVERWWYNEGCYEPFDYREGFEIFDELKKENRYKYGDKDIQIGALLNGEIVAECECEKVDYYQMEYHANNLVMNDISIYNKVESEEWGHDCFNRVISNEYSDEEIANCKLLKDSCLTFDELGKYVCPKGGVNNFYALHLSNVKVFDKPLSFDKDYIYKDYKSNALITKAPQNMCYCYHWVWGKYILISIQPQHLANILNGKKTIEIRKQILNCLKELIK